MSPDETTLPGAPVARSAPESGPPSGRPPAHNGVNRCSHCGASDVSFDGSWLVCAYCQHRWNTAVIADELHLSEGIENLVGTSVLAGAHDIDTSSLVTVECTGCGANVTINSETSLRVTCHWCRHTLSLNNPIDNGAVPDAILPLYVTRADALERMQRYVGVRTKYASDEFTSDFAAGHIYAVYLPYLVVDGNVTVRLEGRAWIQQGSSVTSENSHLEKFKTDEYAVLRETDLLVDDLAIEARSTRSRRAAAVATTNIINAIQPFDVGSAVRFDAHYITEGITFERRDLDVSSATADAAHLFATLARGYVNQTLTQYTGGVRWESEHTAIKGSRWLSILLPVWLYAFEEATEDGPMMHYIAVNGRTGKTEGSVPVNTTRAKRSARIWGFGSAAIFAGIFGGAFLAFQGMWAKVPSNQYIAPVAFLVMAIIALIICLFTYAAGRLGSRLRRQKIEKGQRNPDARLEPERETTYITTRLDTLDTHLREFTHRGGPEIAGRNDHRPDRRASASRVYPSGVLPDRTTVIYSPKAGIVRDAPPGFNHNLSEGQLESAPPPGPSSRRRWYFVIDDDNKS